FPAGLPRSHSRSSSATSCRKGSVAVLRFLVQAPSTVTVGGSVSSWKDSGVKLPRLISSQTRIKHHEVANLPVGAGHSPQPPLARGAGQQPLTLLRRERPAAATTVVFDVHVRPQARERVLDCPPTGVDEPTELEGVRRVVLPSLRRHCPFSLPASQPRLNGRR